MSNKQRILVVDDETRLREMIRMILENRGYSVTEAKNGLEAINFVKTTPPDLILLDVMMPVIDGFNACEQIREFYKGPIIMLTAKGEDYDQVQGLEKGADDYIVKPFTPMVLAARIQAALRRSHPNEPDKIIIGDLVIDKKAREVLIVGQSIDLNRKEYELLLYLAENCKITLSRDQILEHVWGYDYLGSESTVDSHMNRLRKKLGVCDQYVKTLRGFGYKFEVPHED